jgi:hypothetical protein
MEKPSKFCDRGDVNCYSIDAEVTHPHVFDHALTQGCDSHRRLLSELNVASTPTSCLRKEPFVFSKMDPVFGRSLRKKQEHQSYREAV